ncbi:TIGR04283 family arsenosugar biosynthesis glycosyltransferase [Hymenobacter saemangeumensis]|uniref:TIGR04283 family arsenosugar biosynthesis glycosyltransferase n=1 Tax=Hymenobacter saemangeumensis TaxID=1084522 RepID=A0ABP8IM07_9BACT
MSHSATAAGIAQARSAGVPAVGIIIPTYNEADSIRRLLRYLQQHGAKASNIVVVDGGSTDATPQVALAEGATVLHSPRKGRAAQMNYGASHTQASLLYFLHADSYPPPGFLPDLARAVDQGYGSGCYRLAFDHPHWLLRFSGWCTRLPFTVFRFGDQSLFVTRELFEQVGGFREDLLLLEDQDMVSRLRARAPFGLLPGTVTTSARKYLENGVVRLQTIFTGIVLLYWLGVPQQRLVQLYRRLIRQGKV